MRLSQVDFLRQPGQPMAGRLLLGVGTLALLGSLILAHQWRQEHDAAEEVMRATLSTIEQQRTPVPRVPTTAQRRGIQVQSVMARPWTAALGAVESATREPVRLVSLSIDPATGQLRLEGESPTFDEAVTYVQALGAQRALASATLVSHAPATGSEAGIRFSATASWRLP